MKYIIEIEDEPLNHDDGSVQLFRAKGFNSLVFDERGLERLTTYHEDFDYCDNCFFTKCDSTEEPCNLCCHCYMDRFVNSWDMSESDLERFLENMDFEIAINCIKDKDCSRCKYSRLPLKKKCRDKAYKVVSEVIVKLGGHYDGIGQT